MNIIIIEGFLLSKQKWLKFVHHELRWMLDMNIVKREMPET